MVSLKYELRPHETRSGLVGFRSRYLYLAGIQRNEGDAFQDVPSIDKVVLQFGVVVAHAFNR